MEKQYVVVCVERSVVAYCVKASSPEEARSASRDFDEREVLDSTCEEILEVKEEE